MPPKRFSPSRIDPNYITIVQKVRSARESSSLANAVHHAAPVREASIVYHFNVPDYTKLKLRPAASSYTVNSGFSSYSAPSSSGSSQAHHHSRSPFPDYNTNPQGDGYWPSSGQESYGYRDASFAGHRRIHEPSLTAADPAQSIGSGHYSVDGSRWGHYSDVGGDTFPNSFYAEPRATQWEVSGASSPPPAFGRRDNLSYSPMGSSCY